MFAPQSYKKITNLQAFLHIICNNEENNAFPGFTGFYAIVLPIYPQSYIDINHQIKHFSYNNYHFCCRKYLIIS